MTTDEQTPLLKSQPQTEEVPMSDNAAATDSTEAPDLVSIVERLVGIVEDHARRIVVLEAQIKAATPQAIGEAIARARVR